MLRNFKDERTLKENLMLASSTAFVSGVTNVASVLAFLVFTANVTGHVATLAKNIVEQDLHEIKVFALWLLAFFTGTFLANFLVRSIRDTSRYKAHATPIIIETVVLLLVAVYGHHFYEETETERIFVITALLFSMGLQNGLVSNISGGLIKTTHLTGLFTDLGSDVAERLHTQVDKAKAVNERIYVRITILAFYIIGGLVGGYFFNKYDMLIFYFIPAILLTILYYDLSPLALHKLTQWLSGNNRKKQTTSI
ncbi:YoaK family protein [Mucilaginibacter lacusdianchii]|uniref:YoaK family protein n=1 Tax=Mucilaginibacter lacusdianchii TaxID=2684211 RepID=UPI00131C1171|nr:YoaK family protein [Mucilaginibacter sp. JXJ CY 39]